MPNWCSNWTHFRHEQKSEVLRLKTAAAAGALFEEFVPNPNGPNSEDWYSHNTSEWGTKWDTEAHTDNKIEYDPDTKLYTLSISFDTAWSPPVQFYERMVDMGWVIDAYYFEPGMNFCGTFKEGVEDYYEIPATAEEAEEQLPEDLEEVFDICQMLHDREQEEGYEEEE